MARNVHKQEVSKIVLPTEAISEDRGLRNCKVPQLILTSKTDAAYWKNDRTGIAYKLDAITIELEKDGVTIPAPGIEVAFPWQPDAVGFIIDWRQVEEYGCYRVKVNWELSGNEGFFYYGSFNVQDYSPFNARGTVRLLVVLNDLVRRHGINYKDSGFATTIRFVGTFGNMQPNYDVENITYSDRQRQKVRIEAIRTYELTSSMLLHCMTRQIDEETLLAANQIYVTDHNADNHRQDFFDFPVILSEEESPVFEYTGTIYAKIKATFLDKVAAYESKYDGNIKASDNLILSLPTVVTTTVPCADATVKNSDDTYLETVVSGGSLVLPDTEINVYVNGVLNQTVSLPTLDPANELNITA